MRWAYQYIVLNDYLPNVCDPVVVNDVEANGVRYYAPDNDLLFMPLEFWSRLFASALDDSPEVQTQRDDQLTLTADPRRGRPADGTPLKLAAADIIEWHNFARPAGALGSANGAQNRSLDLGRAGELAGIPARFDDPDRPVVATSRAAESAAGLSALDPNGSGDCRRDAGRGAHAGELRDIDAIRDAVIGGNFDTATPLWYYILREAHVQQNGNRLGSVGSRIVAETFSALVHRDRASYLNNLQDTGSQTQWNRYVVELSLRRLPIS